MLGSALAGGALLHGGRARAEVSGADLKFLFVFVYGGWDLTKIYATAFDNPLIDMEADAVLGEIGGLRFVDHPQRPSVRAFFERWHTRTALINGVSVPSVGHGECLKLTLTGDTSGLSPDWPILLAAGSDRYSLPCVVVRGPSFPGSYAPLLTRIGTTGATADLLSGAIIGRSDAKVPLPPAAAQERIDAFLLEQAERRREERALRLYDRYPVAAARARTLEAIRDQVRWPATDALQDQLDCAVDLLALNTSRSVLVEPLDLEDWDTHINNEEQQSWLQEQVFASLLTLMDTLAATPGAAAPTLADETVLVLSGEMGRTPQLNAGAGRDHWGVNAAMICGPRVAGDRTVGGYTDYFYAAPTDLASGAPHASGQVVRGVDYGATLLALADMDPAEWTRDGVPISAVVA